MEKYRWCDYTIYYVIQYIIHTVYNIYIYITRSTVDTKTYHILHLTYITHTYIKYAHVHSNIYIYTVYT